MIRFFSLLVLVTMCLNAAEDVTALRCGKLLDVTGGAYIENAVVVVRDGKVEASGAASSVSIPSGADVIDLGGTSTGNDAAYTLAINDMHQAVGRDRTGTGETHAFLWDNGTTWDLNSLLLPEFGGWELIDAWDINASGQICGSAITPDGAVHAFLATPQSSPSPDDVPEPATWLLVACTGVVGLLKPVSYTHLRAHET